MRTLNGPKKSLARQIWDARWLYLLILPGVLYFVVWHYMPMEGILLAFKKYNARLGIWGSEWVGLKNFKRIFITPAAIKAILNTLRVSLSRLVIEFPAPIILALLLNEVVGKRFKKVLQTVYTFPHFLSWVVVSIIVSNFLSNAGFFNSLLRELGFESVNFLADKALFRPLIYFTSIWKEVGWSSIIYMAAISNVDPALYEAAELDGAGRLQQAWHITVSSIRDTIVLMFIMSVGGMMNAGFDQIFNMSNDVVKEAGQIIDTYVYDITFLSAPNYGFSTAVEVFKAVINLILMLLANKVSKKATGNALFN